MSKSEIEPEIELVFKIQPIPRLLANGDQFWHCFAIGVRDGLYHEKGVWYLPNFSDVNIEPIKYRINEDESRFRRLIESLIHESLHFELLSEIGDKTTQLDNIDKDNDENYIISKIQGDLFNWRQI